MRPKLEIHTQIWFLDVMEWVGQVWRENTSFVIDARTEAFNAPKGHVFKPVIEANQNMRQNPSLVLGCDGVDSTCWRENTRFIIGARTGSSNAPTGRIFAYFLKVTKICYTYPFLVFGCSGVDCTCLARKHKFRSQRKNRGI